MQFEGDVPKTIDELLLLPGVGPKMGFLCLQAAWGIQVGIGVDTHVSKHVHFTYTVEDVLTLDDRSIASAIGLAGIVSRRPRQKRRASILSLGYLKNYTTRSTSC